MAEGVEGRPPNCRRRRSEGSGMLAAVTLALHCAKIHSGAAERCHECVGMRLQDERSGVYAAVPPSTESPTVRSSSNGEMRCAEVMMQRI